MSLATHLSGQKVLYEDEVCVAVLGSAAKGHVRIFSKEEKSFLQLASPQVVHLLSVANQVAICAFDVLSMQGTNVIVNNREAFACVDVISRKEDDGLSFQWELKQGDPVELDKLKDTISDEMHILQMQEKQHKEKSAATAKQIPRADHAPVLTSKEQHKGIRIAIPSLPKELLDESDKEKESQEQKENYLFAELRRIP